MVAGEEADACLDDVQQWMAEDICAEITPWPGNYRELEQCVRNVIIRGAYQPVSVPGDGEGDFYAGFRSGRLKADEVLGYYAALVYRQCGSYEEAAIAAIGTGPSDGKGSGGAERGSATRQSEI